MNAPVDDALIDLGPASDGKGDEPIRIRRRRMIVTRWVIAGMSGAGKSYLLRRYLEATLADTLTFVLDREDDFATLREAHDIAIIGPKGEIPTSVATAAMLARGLVEMHVSAVIDLSGLTVTGEKQRFVREFLQALIDLPRAQWTPMQVVLDEAQEFAPEGGASESRDAVIALMTLGRKRAMCGILCTPRIAMLSKNAAAPAGNYAVGRFLLDNDVERAAKDLGFRTNASRDQIRELQDGEFYCHGQAFEHRGVRRFITGPVLTTHDSDAMDVRPPAPSKRVTALVTELAALQQASAGDVVDEASSSGPGDARLREELHATRGRLNEANEEIERLKTNVRAVDRQATERVLANIPNLAALVSGYLLVEAPAILAQLAPVTAPTSADAASVDPPAASAAKPSRRPTSTPAPVAVVSETPRAARAAPKPVRTPASSTGEGRLAGGAETRMLTAIAQMPGITRRQIGVFAAVEVEGAFRKSIGRFKRFGWVTEDETGGLTATQLGREVLGPYTPLPTGMALVDFWLGWVAGGAERRTLEAIFLAGDAGITREEVGIASNTSPQQGAFRKSIGRFKGIQIVVEKKKRLYAADELLDAMRSAAKSRTRARRVAS